MVNQEQWDFYSFEGKEGPVFISFNQGIFTSIDELPLNHILTIKVNIQDPHENGLPKKKEFPVLNEIEDQFSGHVISHGGIKVGRATFNGAQYYYFYINPNFYDFDSLVQKLKEQYPSEIAFSIKEDPEKSTYKEFLYPTAEEQEDIADVKLVNNLINYKDPLTKPRRIDYWMLFKSIDDLEQFSDWAQKYNLKIEGIQEQDNKYRFALVVYHTAIPTLDHIRRIRNILKDAAKNYNAHYDGWGTQVVLDSHS